MHRRLLGRKEYRFDERLVPGQSLRGIGCLATKDEFLAPARRREHATHPHLPKLRNSPRRRSSQYLSASKFPSRVQSASCSDLFFLPDISRTHLIDRGSS